MKKLIFITTILATASYANAQKVNESAVPAAVKAKFTSLYASVSKVSWEMENGDFEANFDHGKTEMSVLIAPTGKVLETEEGIAVASLPAGVTDYITKNLPGKKIKEASKIKDAHDVVTYEAEVEGMDYTFDEKGNFIKQAKDND